MSSCPQGKPLQQQNNNATSNFQQQKPGTKYESKSYSGPIARASEHKIHPVQALNPFLQNWMIKVRVTNKSDIRHWSNAKGEGSLFSCDLLDEHGTEIRATFFKDAVDKFFDVIHEGKVYFMGGGRLKAANRRFTSIKNEYEITFDTRATIE
jgi:replication factor A1